MSKLVAVRFLNISLLCAIVNVVKI